MNEELLTTRTAAELLGVGTTSVKRWADAGLLDCVRTPGGHRRYPRDAVESLLGPRGPQDDSEPSDGLVSRWLAKLGGEARVGVLVAELEARRDELGSWWRVAEELSAVLVGIGERWRNGRLSVLQEHIASERLARALAQITERLPLPQDAPVALLLVAEGEEHTLGLSLLEVCLREVGYATRWAGRRTPIAVLGAHLANSDVALVAVSASASSDDRAALARQATLLSDVCRAHDVRLLLGGRGAWPVDLPHGDRVTSFAELEHALAGGLRASQEVAS